MVNTRNILLIGRTGNGKSSLANVVTGTDEFREGRFSISKTKKIQVEEFVYNLKDPESEKKDSLENQIKDLEKKSKNTSNTNTNSQSCDQEIQKLKAELEELKKEDVKYKVIDTVGISDTKEGTEMSLDKVLYNLAKVGHIVKDGLNQILFVADGTDKTWKQEISLYNLLKETIFDDDIAKYTTVVRTRFSSFEDESECKKDREILLKSGGEVSKFIDKLKIIHVDNPPVDIPGEGKRVEQQKKLNKETREVSREILLNYLFTRESIYRPKNLDKLNEVLDKNWINKEMLRAKITKEFIQHIGEKDSNLEWKVKEELKKEQSKIEEKIIQLEKGELGRKEVEENESHNLSIQDWRNISEKKQEEGFQTKVNLQNELNEQTWNKIVKELRELNPYLPEKKNFVELKKKINQLEERNIGEKGKKLINEIRQEYIIRSLKENIGEKKDNLKKVKDDQEVKLKEVTKNNKRITNISNLFGESSDENLIQESLEKVCQAQKELTRSKIELENIKKILEKVENYKEQLENSLLEAKIEVSYK